MTYEIVIPDHNYKKEAIQVSGWTETAGTMLPKSTKELEELISNQRSVLLFKRNFGFVGYAAITYLWPDWWAELGAVVVHPEYRGQGWGTIVVAALVGLANTNFADYKHFALCNKYSLGIFQKNGGRIITDPELLPKEVWKECLKCPNFQAAKKEGKLCCDTPVNMTQEGVR